MLGTKEMIELLEMLRQLPEEIQKEIYFMIKGAKLVTEKGI